MCGLREHLKKTLPYARLASRKQFPVFLVERTNWKWLQHAYYSERELNSAIRELHLPERIADMSTGDVRGVAGDWHGRYGARELPGDGQGSPKTRDGYLF